jgi:hypothetical protein
LYKSSAPWKQIRKIGDVVLLNKTLLEVFMEEPKPKEVYSMDLSQNPPRLSVRAGESTISFLTKPGGFAIGIYIGSLLMIFIGLVPYIGALFSGGVAGYIAREWKRGAIAGLCSGLFGTAMIWIILHLLFFVGLEGFLVTVLPSSTLDAIVSILKYATNESFLYFESLVNAMVGLIGGLSLGFLKGR